MHRRAREIDPLGDLTEAQAGWLLLQGPQDRRGAGDDLDLALVLTLVLPLVVTIVSTLVVGSVRSVLLLHVQSPEHPNLAIDRGLAELAGWLTH